MSSTALKRQRDSGTHESKIRVEHLENGCTRYVAGPDARVGDVVVVGGKRVPVLDNEGLREIVARWKNGHAVDLVHVCTSRVTDMGELFIVDSGFNQGIGGWDTSNVENMSGMFCYAYYFNQDISGWNTSNVADMSFMFYEAFAFNQDIGKWDTSNVTDMSFMFQCTHAFNQDISGWNTSKVTDMRSMFCNASTFNQDINGWQMPEPDCVQSMLYGAMSYSMPRDNIHECAFVRDESEWDESDNDESDLDESSRLPRIEGIDAPRAIIECSICAEHVPQVICIPCGHASCISCHHRWTKPTCPTCRATVNKYQRVYF